LALLKYLTNSAGDTIVSEYQTKKPPKIRGIIIFKTFFISKIM
jgi:hypothetical protein